MRKNHDDPFLVNLPLFVVGAAIGLSFADIDQKLPFLVHRSILTHGFLIPLLFLYLIRKQNVSAGTGLRLFTIGFSLANAVHLAFDLFPYGWYKHALIHVSIPFVYSGWMPPVLSILWVLLSVLVCLYIVCSLIRETSEFVLSAAALFIVFWVAANRERHIALSAALTLAAATVTVLAVSGRFTRRKT